MSAGEQELVTRAQSGDTEAFGRLVKQHSAKLFQVAFRLTGNEASAEDVVQEAFIRAYSKLDRFDGRSAFGTWLYRITVNCSMDAMRKKRRSKESADLEPVLEERQPSATDPGPQRLALSREISAQVAAVLAELTSMERTAFVLKHYEGRSLNEIAEIMDLQINAVKHAIFRAVKKLRAELAPLVRGNYETA
jgi:RNA polymerase sigma-70 factor (ECF subfamily)